MLLPNIRKNSLSQIKKKKMPMSNILLSTNSNCSPIPHPKTLQKKGSGLLLKGYLPMKF